MVGAVGARASQENGREAWREIGSGSAGAGELRRSAQRAEGGGGARACVMDTSSRATWNCSARFVRMRRMSLETTSRCVMSCPALYCATTLLSVSCGERGRLDEVK